MGMEASQLLVEYETECDREAKYVCLCGWIDFNIIELYSDENQEEEDEVLDFAPTTELDDILFIFFDRFLMISLRFL